MKKIILFVAMAACLLTAGTNAQAQYTPSWGTNGLPGSYTKGSFPAFYTPVDTFPSGNVAYNDSVWLYLGKGYTTAPGLSNLNSITFQADILKVAGTPTVVATLYEVADLNGTYGPFSGPSYGSAVVAYTVVPTSLTVPSVIQYTVQGNPAVKYLWTIVPSASSSVGCVTSALIR